jgi:hypothetical protein
MTDETDTETDDGVKNVCDAIEHTAPATTVLRFDGENRTFFRQFCDRHAREELAKHDDATVVDTEADPGDVLDNALTANADQREDRDR